MWGVVGGCGECGELFEHRFERSACVLGRAGFKSFAPRAIAKDAEEPFEYLDLGHPVAGNDKNGEAHLERSGVGISHCTEREGLREPCHHESVLKGVGLVSVGYRDGRFERQAGGVELLAREYGLDP